MDSDYSVIALHLIGAVIAGGMIGLERTFHGHPAGFRTHALVCLGACLLMLMALFESKWLPGGSLGSMSADSSRMAQGIMTGIGFLGAGVIFKEGLSVRGLTTAASIWVTAGIGILTGIGFYLPAFLGTLFTLGILTIFQMIDVGEYKRNGAWRPLQPGMTLTVEPGCYVRPADNVPEHFWNIGVRIEDDVLVMETGCEVLTAAAPKMVTEIEELMQDRKDR